MAKWFITVTLFFNPKIGIFWSLFFQEKVPKTSTQKRSFLFNRSIKYLIGATKLVYTLFMFGQYFVQHWFIQGCIFYLFYWEASFLSFCILCEIRCNLHELYNIYIVIVCIEGVNSELRAFVLTY